MRGIVTSRITRSTSSASARSTACGAVIDLRRPRGSRARVEQLAQPVAYDRMIVGEEHAGDQWSGHRASCRQPQRHLACRAARGRSTASCGADQQRPLAHAANPARVVRDFCGQAHAVVAHRRAPRRGRRRGSRREHRPGDALRVPDDVGEALLGDAVDRPAPPRRSAEGRGRTARSTVEPRPARRPSCTDASSALWSPSSSSASGRSRRAISRTSSAASRAPRGARRRRRGPPRERAGRASRCTQDQPGEELADLVVQLARDAPPLGFLGRQRPAARCRAARSRGDRASR